ncbi:Rv3717 family N-acetylmuramoyl-L-alanine amidase [Rhodococcus tukisamuensis]|uniref:N-acetylmuramoyl-L-alanine amidase n=1 Tax=Rhodococcus tukisamuensis TaxID=168276 RepID=A0A1G6MTN2_9NOCA|nr:Rv3717 family N-acetylmuramoyl-L-alanine amidase [Rhodococcus tukisamuensis]SDC58910.1 N-acetylmuramoyl-L-alanine amidase [Rhodococcus tukisamuensis]
MRQTTGRLTALLLLAASAPVLAGCTIPVDDAAAAGVDAPSVAVDAPATPILAGRTVFLDPGHNGANDASAGNQVPTGRGGTKDCQTTGTSTDAGYPEHTFAWEVSALIRAELEALGARVLLSRPDDAAVGPCVDARAEAANAAGVDAAVSVHADGAGPDQHGFHVCYSAPPLNPTQAGPSVAFAGAVRDSLREAGLVPSTYVGQDGLMPREDLAGLNLAQRPTVLVELGNMRNADEARSMTDAAGRARYAGAVARGVADFLDPR